MLLPATFPAFPSAGASRLCWGSHPSPSTSLPGEPGAKGEKGEKGVGVMGDSGPPGPPGEPPPSAWPLAPCWGLLPAPTPCHLPFSLHLFQVPKGHQATGRWAPQAPWDSRVSPAFPAPRVPRGSRAKRGTAARRSAWVPCPWISPFSSPKTSRVPLAEGVPVSPFSPLRAPRLCC